MLNVAGFEIFTGQEARAIARRKAMYGRRDWLVWHTKAGETRAALCTPETVKQAMLDSGTQRKFKRYSAGQGTPMLVWWGLAAMWLRTVKAGHYDHFSYLR